jgi:hypothetical protein
MISFLVLKRFDKLKIIGRGLCSAREPRPGRDAITMHPERYDDCNLGQNVANSASRSVIIVQLVVLSAMMNNAKRVLANLRWQSTFASIVVS